MRFIIACTFLILFSHIYAEENIRPKAKLGISIDKSDTNFDDNPGVAIVAIEENSNAARIGLLVGDRIIAVNDDAITSLELLGTALGKLEVDTEMKVTVLRNGKESTLSGKLKPIISAKTIKERQAELEKQIKEATQSKNRDRYSLQDLLIILRQIEHDLPIAAREFKEIYPNGRFKLSIDIDIDTDTTKDDTEKININDNPKPKTEKTE